MPTIRDTINTVSTDIAALKITTDALSATSTLVIGKTDALTRENEQLKKSVAGLEARVNQLSLAGDAIARRNHRSTPSQPRELTISGLRFGESSEETLLQLVTAIANTLKVTTSLGDFHSARILRKPTTGTSPVRTALASPIKTTFAVVCKDNGVLARIVAAKRTHGAMRFSQLVSIGFFNQAVAAEQVGNPVINVSELLPSNVLKILTATRTQLKPAGFLYIWTRNGIVHVKYANDSPIQVINSISDLTAIALLYSQ